MSKVAVFYYSQTGQGLQVVQNICKPILAAGNEIVYKEIIPEPGFPYPWTSDAFFEVFPESREGIPCTIRPLDFSDILDADLLIIAYQAWFLSPSIPFHAFFQDEEVKAYLKGRNIITVDSCRNMWVMAHIKVKEYIAAAGGKLAGNIVLQDRHHNLVSVITIVRWLLFGKKEKSGLFPAAGVSEKDIAGASVFGEIIARAMHTSGIENLQTQLMQSGAIRYKPNIVFIEKAGHRIFGIWSKFILKKGSYNAPERRSRLKLFKYYLFIVLYLVSPVGLLFFYLAYPLCHKSIQRDRQRQCLLN